MSEKIRIDAIRTDGGTQPRARIDDSTVAEYAEAMEEGAKFPPVTVFYDGSDYWLADGFHRVEAMNKIGGLEIEADVKQGNQRDAILYSVGVNASHGIRRTNEDKRRAVLRLLEDEEWSQWSDREIARRCAVSPAFVDNLRAASANNGQIARKVERNGTVYTQDTANIGKTRAPDPVVNEAPLEEEDEPMDPLAESESEPEPVQSHNATPIEDAISDIRIYINATLDEMDSIAARHQVAREILIFMRDKTREFDQTA